MNPDFGRLESRRRNPLFLSPLEATRASLADGLNALSVIFGLKEKALFRVFVIGLGPDGVGETAAQSRPRRLDRKRRALCDLNGEFHRFFAQAIWLGQHISESPRERFLAGDAPSGVEHQARPLYADDPRQRVCKAESGMNPELHEIRPKAGVGRHHSKVGYERKPEPSANRRALYRRHYRFRTGEEANGVLIKTASGGRNFVAGAGSPRIEVSSGAEGPAFGGEHESSAVVVAIHRLECVREILNELRIEVVVRRPVNLDQSDVAVQPNRHVAVFQICHGSSA